MKKENGFSITELMIAMAIIAIMGAIIIPGFIDWRNRSRLQGYANNLKADFELAKMRAIKENTFVVIEMNQPAFDGYRIYVDGGATAWTVDPGERVLREVEFPDGLEYDPVTSSFINHRTRFNGRGLPGNIGTAVLVQGSDQRQLTINRVGRLTLQ